MNGLLIVFWCDLVVDKILVDLTYLEDTGFFKSYFWSHQWLVCNFVRGSS